MAQYRRKLSKSEQKHIHAKYKHHKNDDTGIFTSDRRTKLLGLKPKDRTIKDKNMSNFWSDVRKYSKLGLSDLHLVADVGNQNQLNEIFGSVPFNEWDEDQSRTDISKLLRTIFSSQPRSNVKKVKGMLTPIPNDESDIWLANLAYDVVLECFKFFKEHNLVTSITHERLIDETEDMLNSEIGRAIFVSRHYRNIRI